MSVPVPFLLRGLSLGMTLPVHDPPAVWKSWRGNEGGNPGVEVQMLPLFSTARVWRFDTNNLPQLEPITGGKER